MSAFLLVTDLDHTLVGDAPALATLNQYLSRHRQEFGTTIAYSTGRSPALYRQLTTEESLLTPDVLILSVGTEIYLADHETPDPHWTALLSRQWDRDQVTAIATHFTDLIPQPDTEQRPFKASYFLTPTAAVDVLPPLQDRLTAAGLDAQLIYSGSLDLDIIPRRADKGQAMTFLREHLGIAAAQTVACGDSGNDLAMFRERPERGIIVGNAKLELLDWHHTHPNPDRYLATAHCAGGILEGLRYFGFLE